MKNTQDRKQKKSRKNAGGRPSEFTDLVVKKLEEAFAIDATVEEACFYAGISRQTYYNNVKEGSKLFDRLQALRNRPVLKARQTVVQKIGESYSNAMDYLSRKRKLEFSTRNELTGADGESLFDNEHKDKAEKAVKEFFDSGDPK